MLAVRGNGRDTGSDEEAYVFEPAQFVHYGIDLPGVLFLGVNNGLGVVEDDEHLLGGKKRPQECQVLGVLNPCTNDLGESGEEMRARCRELIATDEPTVIAKPLFDPVVMEDGESNGCFPDPPRANESDRFEVFG